MPTFHRPRRDRRHADSGGTKRPRPFVCLSSLAATVGLCATALLTNAGSASAATGVQAAGSVGAVYEAVWPGKCWASAYGYDVYAYGPTVYGPSATTEYAYWRADLWDNTTRQYVRYGSWSSGYAVTNTHGINFNATSNGWQVNRGDALYADVTIDWMNASRTTVTGSESYLVNNYAYAYGTDVLAQSHC